MRCRIYKKRQKKNCGHIDKKSIAQYLKTQDEIERIIKLRVQFKTCSKKGCCINSLRVWTLTGEHY